MTVVQRFASFKEFSASGVIGDAPPGERRSSIAAALSAARCGVDVISWSGLTLQLVEPIFD
jgi:hypothetical protein